MSLSLREVRRDVMIFGTRSVNGDLGVCCLGLFGHISDDGHLFHMSMDMNDFSIIFPHFSSFFFTWKRLNTEFLLIFFIFF